MKVVLYNGLSAERRECRRIKGKFYKMNESCFKVDTMWRRIDDPRMAYDIDNDVLISVDKVNQQRLRAKSIDNENNIIYISSKSIPSGYLWAAVSSDKFIYTSPEIIKTMKYSESYDLYYFNKDVLEYAPPHPIYNDLKYSFNKVKGVFSGKKFSIDKSFNVKSKYTFGLELETEDGRLPIKDLYKYGITPLRDGSINGYEYTSVPFSNIGQGVAICDAVNRQCDIGIRNSVHVHVGSVDHSKNGVVKMYHTYWHLQNELYKMFPPYKKENNGVKSQNYTSPLPKKFRLDKDEYFNQIFSFLLNGEVVNYESTVMKHPLDPSGDHKWQIKSRYRCVNLVNMLFSDSRTVEIRLHEGSLNKYKIIYWLLINEAIVDYVQNNDYETILSESRSKSLNINMIISKYARKTHRKALKAYVEERKSTFSIDNAMNDPLFRNEIRNDKNYLPKIKLF